MLIIGKVSCLLRAASLCLFEALEANQVINIATPLTNEMSSIIEKDAFPFIQAMSSSPTFSALHLLIMSIAQQT